MKPTSIIRRLDDLGRIVIPKEIRRQVGVREGSPMEIYVSDEKSIVLKLYSPIENLSERVIQISREMARMSSLELSIYDCYHKITSIGFSPDSVKEWDGFYKPTEYSNGIVIPIIKDGEKWGYIFSENTKRIDELLMIARYICAEISV